MLVAAADGERLITGGDDGRVAVTGPDGSTRTFAEAKGAWIDALAASPSGAVAYAAGRRVFARDDRGRERTLDVPSTARGLAFAPKGYRLAISHYNGATLWFPNVEAKPEGLEWKGSHLDVTWSPDARFLVSSMQENALHGWRLVPDKAHMRMSGYPSKTRSFSWSHDGKCLATSGAEAAIIWPFDTKEGPTGKAAAGMRRPHRPGEPGRVPPAQPGPRRRLRGRLHPPRPPRRRLGAPGPPGDEGGRGDGPRLGQARHGASPSAAPTAKPAS